MSPTGGDNVNSGAVNAYRPNNSRLNVVRPNSVDGAATGNAGSRSFNVTRPSRGLDVNSGGESHNTESAQHSLSVSKPVQFNRNVENNYNVDASKHIDNSHNVSVSKPVTLNHMSKTATTPM